MTPVTLLCSVEDFLGDMYVQEQTVLGLSGGGTSISGAASYILFDLLNRHRVIEVGGIPIGNCSDKLPGDETPGRRCLRTNPGLISILNFCVAT